MKLVTKYQVSAINSCWEKYENWHFPNWLKSHLSLAPPFINTMYVTTWPISKRGNKWEMLSYEGWMDGRTAVCHNKPAIYVLDDKKVYTILKIISFHYERRQIGLAGP
jgi:hypothetical protein